MKFTIPFNLINAVLGDTLKLNDFNYQLPKEAKHSDWQRECDNYLSETKYKIQDIKAED